MKITFNGSSAVDIDGLDEVEPGATIEVADELAARLLQAGASIDADGNITPPVEPLWSRADGKKSKPDPAATAADPIPPAEGVTEGN